MKATKVLVLMFSVLNYVQHASLQAGFIALLASFCFVTPLFLSAFWIVPGLGARPAHPSLGLAVQGRLWVFSGAANGPFPSCASVW